MYKLKEGKIGTHGLLYILILYILGKIFLGFPRALADEGGPAAWILILFASTIGFIGVFFMVKLLQKFPGENFFVITEKLWGRTGAILVGLTLFLFFVYLAAAGVREFAESMLITVLPQTPISVITFLFVAVMVMGAYNGLEVITRAAAILFPFVLGGIFSILLLSSNFINLNNLFPILGKGLGSIIYHSPGRSTLFIEILMVGVIAADIKEHKLLPKQVWKAMIISALVFLVVELFYISVLRNHAAEALYVPLFQMARIIYLDRFVQRLEAFYIFVWFFSGGLMLTLSLYGAAVSLARTFKIPIYQPLVFPTALLIFAFSFVPAGVVTAVYLDMGILRKFGALLWLLPAALLITAVIKGKGGTQAGQQKQS